jgi:hypothetical protein
VSALQTRGLTLTLGIEQGGARGGLGVAVGLDFEFDVNDGDGSPALL